MNVATYGEHNFAISLDKIIVHICTVEEDNLPKLKSEIDFPIVSFS